MTHTTPPGPEVRECQHCTVPTDGGDVCGFCQHYDPTRHGVDSTTTGEALATLAGAVKYTRWAAEDCGDTVAALPDDAPLFAVADVVTAKAHMMTASRLLARAAAQLHTEGTL